jgi:hypothetical protein
MMGFAVLLLGAPGCSGCDEPNRPPPPKGTVKLPPSEGIPKVQPLHLKRLPRVEVGDGPDEHGASDSEGPDADLNGP